MASSTISLVQSVLLEKKQKRWLLLHEVHLGNFSLKQIISVLQMLYKQTETDKLFQLANAVDKHSSKQWISYLLSCVIVFSYEPIST